MPGTVTLIMRDPKRAGNLPSDFFTLKPEAGAKFPSKKVSFAEARQKFTLKKVYTQKSYTRTFPYGLYPRCEKEYDRV